MWPLIRDFFTVKAYAVRLIRYGLVVLAQVVAGGVPQDFEAWLLALAVALPAALTGTSGTKSGLDNSK